MFACPALDVGIPEGDGRMWGCNYLEAMLNNGTEKYRAELGGGAVIPALGRGRQGDQILKVSLSYIARLRPA